jgi:hypothetical protein
LILIVFLVVHFVVKPERVQPVISQSLTSVLEAAYPSATNLFAMGPWGGEMGVENLVEFDLGSGKNSVHVIGRDFLQTETEHTRLLTFLKSRGNQASFLSNMAFPHHNVWIDPVQAMKVHTTCLHQDIPAMQMTLTGDSHYRIAWLALLPYRLEHPRWQHRLVWLLALGNGPTSAMVVSSLSQLPALNKNPEPFAKEPVIYQLFGRTCQP